MTTPLLYTYAILWSLLIIAFLYDITQHSCRHHCLLMQRIDEVDLHLDSHCLPPVPHPSPPTSPSPLLPYPTRGLRLCASHVIILPQCVLVPEEAPDRNELRGSSPHEPPHRHSENNSHPAPHQP